MPRPIKAVLGSVKIRTATVSEHGIQDVIFIAVDMSAEKFGSGSYDKLIETAVQLGMCALSVDDNDYYMVMTLPSVWFVGTPEMMTMFSLKYKNYIKVFMNQETMDGAIRVLKTALLSYPNYHMNYIDALFRIVTDHWVVLQPDMRYRWRANKEGRRNPTSQSIRVLLENPQ